MLVGVEVLIVEEEVMAPMRRNCCCCLRREMQQQQQNVITVVVVVRMMKVQRKRIKRKVVWVGGMFLPDINPVHKTPVQEMKNKGVGKEE